MELWKHFGNPSELGKEPPITRLRDVRNKVCLRVEFSDDEHAFPKSILLSPLMTMLLDGTLERMAPMIERFLGIEQRLLKGEQEEQDRRSAERFWNIMMEQDAKIGFMGDDGSVLKFRVIGDFPLNN